MNASSLLYRSAAALRLAAAGRDLNNGQSSAGQRNWTWNGRDQL